MNFFRKYYLDDDLSGGGEVPVAPKGYTPTTPQQRTDWNNFLDYAGKQTGANLSDPKQQATLLATYKKANPNFSITVDQIPAIQYEAYQIRKGDTFGKLGAKELGYLRQGLSPNFINADTANVGKLYYPQEQGYGTDLEGYYNSKFNPEAAAIPRPGQEVSTPQKPTLASSLPSDAIPRPDYTNAQSRINFANQFNKKYGIPIGQGYGDIPLRVNETPEWGSDSSKNLAIKAAHQLGLDPALLYASSMIEGQSGLYPQKNKKTGNMEVNTTGDDNYPVSAMWSFGLDSLPDYLPMLIKKGYLPKDFDKNYKIWDKPAGAGGPGGKETPDESVMFKTTDAGVQAKAAMMRQFYDEFDDYARSHNLKLTPEQRDFFALAHFNSGEHGFQLLRAYDKAGLLKNDDFLKKRPAIPIAEFVKFYKGDEKKAEALHKQIYENVAPRIAAAKGLKQEKLFE